MTTSAPATLLLDHHLKHLKLPTILREYKPQAQLAAKERYDYPTYLLRLTEQELIEKFKDLTAGLVPDDEATALVGRVLGMENLSRMNLLFEAAQENN